MHIILHTNYLIPKRFSAYTIGFLVLIRPWARNDKALVQHELTHVRQFWRNPFSGILSLCSRKHRLRYEVEAYRNQLRYVKDYDYNLELFAWFLSNNYNLNISKDDAKRLLTSA